MRDVYGIVVAAGEGQRFGSGRPKQFASLAGRPLLAHTLANLARAPLAGIVVALPPAHLESFEGLVRPHLAKRPEVRTVEGGATRALSVRAGLEAIPGSVRFVLVHDGARPFVDRAICESVLAGARRMGACIPALALGDTIKEVGEAVARPAREGGSPRAVVRTVDRARLVAAQTPQAFSVALLRKAFAALGEKAETATDCAQLLEWTGQVVGIVEGRATNIKVTLPFDMAVAGLILAGQS